MKTPLISVIVPVYNTEDYLSNCVKSLIDQTYKPIEIILVDDGSSDGCPAICDAFAAEHDNILVIHQENKGLSCARNIGIENARGELLSFVDSDDEVKPDMLEKLYALMTETGADISSSGIENDRRIDGVFTPAEAIRYITEETVNLTTSAWGKLYRAELFDGILYPEGLIFEDYAVTPLLFDRANKIAHTGEVLYIYRADNTEGITHSKFSPKRMDYFTVSETVDEFYREKYPSLIKISKNRRTRCAIAFFRQMVESGERMDDVQKTLVSYTRCGIFQYLFSSYKLTSKAYGLLISVCPPLARKLFSR